MKTLLTFFFGFIFIVIAGTCIDFLCVEFFHHEPTLLDALAVAIVYWLFKKKDANPSTQCEASSLPYADPVLILPPL
jgi:hypothetical protein